MFKERRFLIAFISFLLLQIAVYLTIVFFHTTIPLAQKEYHYESHHYFQDGRFFDGEFSFLRSLGVWDAQWYLRIADDGYPPKVVFDKYIQEPRFMGALTYAFFPFYPLILFLFNQVFHNIEVTAFIVTNLLLIANFFSLYYVITKLFSKNIAIKTLFLLFFFPFSIFYRVYFTESIFLLQLVWFSYFLIKQKWFYTVVLASLMFITRPNGIILGLMLLFIFVQAIQKGKLTFLKAALYGTVTLIPFGIWCLYTASLTGNPFYWYYIQHIWFDSPSPLTFFHTIEHMFGFFHYPIHTARESRIDILMGIGLGLVLTLSYKFFKKYPQLWWIAFIIFITPLVLKDFMSYSRYQIISFPIFIYLASVLRGKTYWIVSGVFLALLLYASVYLINWHWMG